MKIFINEMSLEGQYYTCENFRLAIVNFINIVQKIEDFKLFRFYKKSDISTRQAIPSQNFLASLNTLPVDLRTLYKRIVFDRTNPINWDSTQKHTCCYLLNGNKIDGTSIAEFAECKSIVDEEYLFLLNYSQSSLQNQHMIQKNLSNLCQIDFKDNQVDIDLFIKSNSLCRQYIYTDYNNTPRDEQTFLRDSRKYKPTNAEYDNRTIYMCDQGNYWYLDNKHKGMGAHIEVFGNNLEHIGTSLIYTCNVDAKHKKPRNIKNKRDQLFLKN